MANTLIFKHLFAYLFAKGIILISNSNRPLKDLYKNDMHALQVRDFFQNIACIESDIKV